MKVMESRSNRIKPIGLKTAIIMKGIVDLSMRGLGEYVTIRMRSVMDELGIRDVDRKKYIKAFIIAMRLLEPCIVSRIGGRNNRKYVIRRECIWRLVDLASDFGD